MSSNDILDTLSRNSALWIAADPPRGGHSADLWWPSEPRGKCDLCERIAVPTARCVQAETGTTANLCVCCWAFGNDDFYPESRC